MKPLYTAKATTQGGRSGHVKSDDNVIDMQLSVPSDMGGEGGAHTNPEQLFAAGYSACFGSALDLVISKEKVNVESTAITSEVTIGKGDDNGFELVVKMIGEIKGVEKEKAKELMEKAHQVCPYSKATRGNIDVTLDVK
ncbi:Ohr family peroxiredoxin [Flavobacteriaceae bacterium Ap0902]|nr:Ohr family peroxiredoxin [Flavobacteriaceae bacterium Ap0902]